MTALSPRDEQKRAAAEAAVAEVRDGMIVGLGTGTTAAFAIAALGERCRAGLTIRAVATSFATEAAARAAGIAIGDFADLAAVDLCIDGVDEIDGGLRAIKGGGGAMLREKIVAASAARMIAVADASKPVERLGAAPVPVEILPFARGFVAAAVARLGGRPVLRSSAGAPFRSDQGNWILDCAFPRIADPAALATRLSTIPGALGHGLFLDEIDELYLGTDAGVLKSDRRLPGRDDPSLATGSFVGEDRSTTVSANEAG